MASNKKQSRATRDPRVPQDRTPCGILGIDLGTSSVKVVVINANCKIIGIGAAEYPINTPHPGFAEQDPAHWWSATVAAVKQAVAAANRPEIRGISFSAQMHGGVLIDAQNKPVIPAIIWADQRSAGELEEIESVIGRENLVRTCGTLPAAGFMIATLRWLLRHRPDLLLDRTQTLLLPKDYVRLKMTHELATDPSDASSTGLFDITNWTWSDRVIHGLGLPKNIFPQIRRSTDLGGYLTQAAAAELGLPSGLPSLWAAPINLPKRSETAW
jgi:xylulokinase